MYALSQLFMALGLVGLLISCAATAIGAGPIGLVLAFGLLIVGILLRIASRAPKADPDAPDPRTHVRCPDCRELVRHDATKCRHCGAALQPQPAPGSATGWSDGAIIKATVGAMVAAIVALGLLRL